MNSIFSFILDLEAYVEQGILLAVALILGLLIYRSFLSKTQKIPEKYTFLNKFFNKKFCFWFSQLVSLGLLSPWYMLYLPDQKQGIVFAAMVCGAQVLTRLTKSLIRPYMAFPLNTIIWLSFTLIATGLTPHLFKILTSESLKIGKMSTSILKIVESTIIIAGLIWLAFFVSKKTDEKLESNKQINKSTQLLLSKLVKVSLVALSFLLGLSIVGIDLSILTFFAGALGVAIGLGLQNIVSNFFCGIILLLDRSIRPGDVLTIEEENTYGIVHKLNARYISIRTREGIEHLIPNEYFINKKSQSWTHSDPYVRFSTTFDVGINTDLDQLETILLKIAGEMERIIPNPEPCMRTLSVQANCIKVELRAWIKDPENGFSGIRHDIYKRALAIFKEEGIEIPVPPLHLLLNEKLGALDKLPKNLVNS